MDISDLIKRLRELGIPVRGYKECKPEEKICVEVIRERGVFPVFRLFYGESPYRGMISFEFMEKGGKYWLATREAKPLVFKDITRSQKFDSKKKLYDNVMRKIRQYAKVYAHKKH